MTTPSTTPRPQAWTGRLTVLTLLVTTLGVAGGTASAEGATGRTTYTQPSPVHVEDEGHQIAGTGPISLSGTSAGAGAPYPAVSSSTHAATITDVDVWVKFSHDRPADLELLLIGPGGHQVLLMNGAGGTSAVTGAAVTFDQEAAAELPSDDAWSSGAYQPASYGALALEATDLTVTASTELSVFDTTNAAGPWQLYAYDDAPGGGGMVLDWALDVEVATTPSPSTLAVANIGRVSDVDLVFEGFTSACADDHDWLLVGPQGHSAMIMSDAGGCDPTTPLRLVFDDDVSPPIPDDPTGVLASGTYHPHNYADDDDGASDSFPGLGELVNSPSALSVFDGTDPNGTWRLYAADDSATRTGLLQGWSLHITWEDPAAPTGTVSIAGGAPITETAAVTLAVSAADPLPGSGLTLMRFSNDGASYSAWQTYASSAPWMLAAGRDGTRRVHAQFADALGNLSPVVFDEITLDANAPSATSVQPRRNARDVSPRAKVRVTITERLEASTVTARTMVLRKGAKKVRARVTLATGRQLVLVPRKPLAPGRYTATVTTKVTDRQGKAFDARAAEPGAQALSWRFTVRPALVR